MYLAFLGLILDAMSFILENWHKSNVSAYLNQSVWGQVKLMMISEGTTRVVLDEILSFLESLSVA